MKAIALVDFYIYLYININIFIKRGGIIFMKMKFLIYICLILFITSIASVSAVDDANNTVGDSLSLSQGDYEIANTFADLQMVDEVDESAVININSDLMDNSSDDSLSEDVYTDNILKSSNIDFVGRVNNGTFNDIQNLINDASSGDVIVLNGYYSGQGSQISINKPVTIIGVEDTVLDAKCLSSIFYVGVDNVCIENINFINGQYATGGAIKWYGDSGVLINSTFINNYADWGGAIYWWASNGYLSDCLFINNTAASYGGALYVNGRNLRMLSSAYINNVVTDNLTRWQGGGAIYTDLTPDYAEDSHIIANSTFIANKAINSWGGALKLGSGSAIFDSNEFHDNFAIKGTSIFLGDIRNLINNKFYLNSIDELNSCVEEGNLSNIFNLNTFLVNGKVVSKNSYFNNETASDVVVDYNDDGGSRLVISLKDAKGNAISGVRVNVAVGGITGSILNNDKGQVYLFLLWFRVVMLLILVFLEMMFMLLPALLLMLL